MTSKSSKPGNKKVVVHVTGPGDVIGSYRYWKEGKADPHEMSETYSGQFFSRVREMSLSAYVISSHMRREVLDDGWITIEHRPKASLGKAGIYYQISEIRYWFGVIRSIFKAKADVAVVAAMEHWWLLALLRVANIEVVPSLHGAFWPMGHKPDGMRYRLIRVLNGWFWRYIPIATISISPECERQVQEVAGFKLRGVLIQARPKYIQGYLDTVPPANWDARPFGLLFAGRIERDKGVFDLLDLADRLQGVIPEGVVIEVCGTGGAVNEFSNEIDKRGLTGIVKVLGRLDRHEMWLAYSRAHVTIVPTGIGCAEGLNKVVVEGVLAGRPVIATDVCPAIEVTRQSTIRVQPGDVEAMAMAVTRLASDRSLYELQRACCKEEAKPFYDLEQSWGAALRTAIQLALTGQLDERGTSSS